MRFDNTRTGSYDVRIWKTQYADFDHAASMTVNYDGGASTSTVDFNSGTSG